MTAYSTFAIERSERDRETGNAIAKDSRRYHDHHGLVAGETTVAGHLVRVAMRSVAGRGSYDPEAFLAAFVDHLATPGRNRDPYNAAQHLSQRREMMSWWGGELERSGKG